MIKDLNLSPRKISFKFLNKITLGNNIVEKKNVTCLFLNHLINGKEEDYLESNSVHIDEASVSFSNFTTLNSKVVIRSSSSFILYLKNAEKTVLVRDFKSTDLSFTKDSCEDGIIFRIKDQLFGLDCPLERVICIPSYSLTDIHRFINLYQIKNSLIVRKRLESNNKNAQILWLKEKISHKSQALQSIKKKLISIHDQIDTRKGEITRIRTSELTMKNKADELRTHLEKLQIKVDQITLDFVRELNQLIPINRVQIRGKKIERVHNESVDEKDSERCYTIRGFAIYPQETPGTPFTFPNDIEHDFEENISGAFQNLLTGGFNSFFQTPTNQRNQTEVRQSIMRSKLSNTSANAEAGIYLVCKLLTILATVYDIPLRFPIQPYSTRDGNHTMRIVNTFYVNGFNQRHFPLAYKRSTTLSEYRQGIQLLNMSILAIRGFFHKHTPCQVNMLANLRDLLDDLI